MLFAHRKRILKLDRLRLRGPNGAQDEFHLAATPKPPKARDHGSGSAGNASAVRQHPSSSRLVAPSLRRPDHLKSTFSTVSLHCSRSRRRPIIGEMRTLGEECHGSTRLTLAVLFSAALASN